MARVTLMAPTRPPAYDLSSRIRTGLSRIRTAVRRDWVFEFPSSEREFVEETVNVFAALPD